MFFLASLGGMDFAFKSSESILWFSPFKFLLLKLIYNQFNL